MQREDDTMQWEDDVMQREGVTLVQIDDNKEEFTHLPTINALHVTYPYFVDDERADVLMNEGEDMLVGNVDPDLKKQHTAQLARALKQVPVYVLKGTREFICTKIRDIIDDKESSKT